jgi:hypothetical protein
MKGFCYIVLIIGFFMFFQQNPLYAVILIGIFIAAYLYIKSKRAGSSGGVFGFMKGNQQQQNSSFDDIITLMILQQLFNTPGSNSPARLNDTIKEKSREEQIEQTKQEVLELLDE